MTATQEHLEYLDELRASGETNMYGAGPYLRREFGVSQSESHAILAEWMRTFTQRRAARQASHVED